MVHTSLITNDLFWQKKPTVQQQQIISFKMAEHPHKPFLTVMVLMIDDGSCLSEK